MPLATQLTFVQQAINGIELPFNLGTLNAFVAPPPGGVDATFPTAYVWGSSGDEARLTVPRATEGSIASGGHKQQETQVAVWLTWVTVNDDPDQGVMFPAVMDAVMARLRNVALLDQAQHALDPVTGRGSSLVDVGERMSWDMPPPRGIEGAQQLWRYDGLITAPMTDIFQS